MTDWKAIPSRIEPKSVDATYAFFVASVGFEQRSRHIAETIRPRADRLVAMGFPDRHLLHYEANAAWFADSGYEVYENATDDVFADRLKDLLSSSPENRDPLGCVDISSLTRSRMAAIIELCCSGHIADGATIDFLYTLGAYAPPSTSQAPNTYFGPISAFFAGWATDPNKPPVALVGLGYEEGKALGATEYIQADEIWAFIPESPIEEYGAAVIEANQTLLQFLPEPQRIGYRPDDPVDCYQRIESLLYGVVPFGRPIILPFGPKIFSLMALIASLRYKEASVWRVSAQENELPTDRLASDHVIGVRIRFGKKT